MTQWLTIQNRDFIKQGIQKDFQHYNKCLDCGENYVEKQWNSSSIEPILFLLQLKIIYSKYMQCKLKSLTASQTSELACLCIFSELCFCAITILGDSMKPCLFLPTGEKAIYRSLIFFPAFLYNLIRAQFGKLKRVCNSSSEYNEFMRINCFKASLNCFSSLDKILRLGGR